MVSIECVGDVPTLFVRLNERLNNLRNHLNGYILAIVRNSGESFHFELANVSLITFCDDGFEVILLDSSTIYLRYSVIDEFSLVRLDKPV